MADSARSSTDSGSPVAAAANTWYDRRSGSVFGRCAHGAVWFARAGVPGGVLTACQLYPSGRCAPEPNRYGQLHKLYPRAIRLV